MTKIINIAGAPGAGKSTTAAGLFHLMKLKKFNVELVTEWIKGGVWEERFNLFNDQLYITAKQNRQLHRLIGKVDYIISDSPLFLGAIYAPFNYHNAYKTFLMELYHSYDNTSYFLNRVKSYNPAGRSQTELQSNEIGYQIKSFMNDEKIKFKELNGDEKASELILEDILNMKKVCRLCDRELDIEKDILQSEGICNYCSIT